MTEKEPGTRGISAALERAKRDAAAPTLDPADAVLQLHPAAIDNWQITAPTADGRARLVLTVTVPVHQAARLLLALGKR